MVILVMLLVAVLLVATSKNREITSTTKGKRKEEKLLINATKRERQGDMIMRKAFVWIGTVVLILLLCVKAIVDNKKRKEAI